MDIKEITAKAINAGSVDQGYASFAALCDYMDECFYDDATQDELDATVGRDKEFTTELQSSGKAVKTRDGYVLIVDLVMANHEIDHHFLMESFYIDMGECEPSSEKTANVIRELATELNGMIPDLHL